MKISDFLKKESIIPLLSSKSKKEVLGELSELVASQYPSLNSESLVDTLQQREDLCSTALDSGVAIPHCKMSGLNTIIAAVGKSDQGVDFDSLDGKPSHLFILILAPDNSAGSHLKLLARISNVFKSPVFRQRIMNAETQEDMYDLIAEEDEKH